jgi:peptidyl-prolyl cis-trans isomerase D
MATLEKIRTKFGVIAAGVIGLSLVAFILSDLFDSRSSMFRGSKFKIAEIAGNSVSYQQFEQKVNDLIEIYKLNSGQDVNEQVTEGIREQAWEQIVNENIMTDEYDELGLAISAEELFDFVQGADPHPIVRQIFTNQETGQFNKAGLMQFLKNLNQDQTGKQMTFWLYVENEIKSQRLNTKYLNLIRQGVSAPTFVAKIEYNDNNKKADVNFVVQRLTSISDSAVSVTAADLKKYYKEHSYLYEQNAARDFEYITFDVTPSGEDKVNTLQSIEKLKTDFAESTEVEQFVNSNSDVSYIDKNYKNGELGDSLDALMFNSEPGVVYGPYLDGPSYKLARLYKVVNVPDSVKARHILIKPAAQTQEAYKSAKALADSLLKLIEKGGNFAELAKTNSEDRSNADKGGDLGWFKDGMMVKPFNDAAFSAVKGKAVEVETNFGIHLLEVTDRGKEVKKVKVAFLVHKIEPSSQTYQKVYNDAVKFASENDSYENFVNAAAKQKLVKMNGSLGENDKTIMGIESPRTLIRWIYNAKEKQVSEPLDLGKQYVVAALVDIKKKGIASIGQVKNEVELAVRKEKKAEKIAEKMSASLKGASSLQDLAAKLNTTVESAPAVTFSSYSLPSVGAEPKVVAYATNLPQGKLSDVIQGSNGVYVVSVSNIVQPEAIKDYTATLTRINSAFQSRASYDAFSALRKLANIEDKRANFY